MRILLKKGDKHISIYHIKRQNNCIVGWFSDKQILKQMLPEIETDNSDIHFTYHADGNYHISLKYKDGSSNEIERRLFFDKIVIKNISTGITQTLPKTETSIFEGLLTPNYKPAPFSNDHLFFQTPVSNFSLDSDWLLKWFDDKLVAGTIPRKDDLIVDIEEKRGSYINASAVLMGVNYDSTVTNPDFALTIKEVLKVEDKTSVPYIQLQVFIQ